MHPATEFDSWWSEAGGDAAGDPALEPRVRVVHAALVARVPDLSTLRGALVDLLEHLAGSGRTPDNCRTVDAFLCLLTAEHTFLVERLPPGWQDLIDDLGIDLGAALDDPEAAERAGATPERLLERARALAAGGSG